MEESTEEPVRMRNSSSKEVLSLPGCKGYEAEAEVEEEAVYTGCGWRCFRPRILAPFAHVWTFIVLYIVFAFTHAVQGSYPIAVLTTLERRFNLPSSLAGFLVNTSVFGYFISIVVCSLFLAKANNPRLFACCMLLTSIGAFLYYLPHIVSGTGNDAIDTAHAQMQQTSLNNVTRSEIGSGGIQLCGGGGGSNSGSTADGSSEAPERGMCRDMEEGQTPAAVHDDGGVSYVVSAVAILSIADLVHGIAGAPGWVVGLAYIDDHTDPELSAKLIGLMYTVRLISPIVSFAMGGYLLSIHSTLKDTELTPKHPQWIGAWWMGFLINSIINFIIAIPMSMLPGKLRPIRKSTSIEDSPEKGKATPEKVEWKQDGKKKEQGRDDRLGKEGENEKREKNGNGEEREADRNRNKVKETEEYVGNEGKYRKREDQTDGEEEKREARLEKKELVEDMKISSIVKSTTGEQSSIIGRTKPIDASSIDWKEFPKAMIRLITNPIYVLTVLAICSDWAALEFMSFMPKYFEVHFQKTASVANLLGGMIPAMFAAVASYVGGVKAGKVKGMDGGVAGLCRMNFSLTLISVLLFVPALLLSCPNIKYSGHLVNDRLNLTTDCNVNCDCSSDVFDPVCGSDRLLYFSPCYAGCTQLINLSSSDSNDLEGQLVRSKECHCVGDVEERNDDDDDERGKIVFAGFCDESCASLIPFIFILIAIVVVSCLYNSSSTTIILRCIKKEDKSFALGFEALCICFSQVPAPLLYGMIYDTSCVMKTATPCTDSKGSCQLYDRHALRLHFHGLAMGLKSIATILYGAAYVQARRKLSLLTAEEKMRPTAAMAVLNEDTM